VSGSPGWVLVHSPATGPVVWRGVAEQLRAAGHQVSVPDLRPTLTGGPGWTARQIELASQSTVDGPCIVVGHSAAGALLPGIGAALGDVAGYLFVDAVMPRPGRTFEQARTALMDFIRSMAAGGEWTKPWSQWWGDDLAETFTDPALLAAFEAECRPLPVEMFREPAPVIDGWPDAPCGYLRFSDGYSTQAPRDLGWPVMDHPGDHLEMMFDPTGVTKALLALFGEIAANVPRMSEESREFTPDRSKIDLSRDPNPGVPDHLAPDDAGERPFIDLSRDPNPGRPAHAAPDDDEE
jgi:hypothetical protein